MGATTVHSASFVKSSSKLEECPKPDRVEVAFIGRSNVGKSSLINMLVNQKKLAKTSGRPGKTQLINHFLVNEKWYLVDLPGYGYARVSQTQRKNWGKTSEEYLLNRKNLSCVLILLDVRHEPQKIDVEFINWAGKSGLPLALIFTKADKLSQPKVQSSVAAYRRHLKKSWEELPLMFVSSAESGTGREEILEFITSLQFK